MTKEDTSEPQETPGSAETRQSTQQPPLHTRPEIWNQSLVGWFGVWVFERLVRKAYATTGMRYMSSIESQFRQVLDLDEHLLALEGEVAEYARRRARFEAKKEALKETLQSLLKPAVVVLWLSTPLLLFAFAHVDFGMKAPRVVPLAMGITLFLAPVLFIPLLRRLVFLIVFELDLRPLWIAIASVLVVATAVASAAILVQGRAFAASHHGSLDWSWWALSSGGMAWLLAGGAGLLGVLLISVLVWWLTGRWERANPDATMVLNLLAATALCGDGEASSLHTRRLAFEYLNRTAEVIELSLPTVYGPVPPQMSVQNWRQELGAGFRRLAQEVYLPTTANREALRTKLTSTLAAGVEGLWGDLPRETPLSPGTKVKSLRVVGALRSVLVALIPAGIYGLARAINWVEGSAANYIGAIVLLWAAVKFVTSFDPEAGKTLSLMQEVRATLRVPTGPPSKDQ